MRPAALVTLVLIAACSSATALSTAATTAAQTVVETLPASTSVGASTLPCPRPDFAPVHLPDRVGGEAPAPQSVDVDRWTAQPGTSLAIWTDQSGLPVAALVRGALPPERWSASPSVVAVRGVDAALGPLSDGMWAVAWFEGPDRCDDYTLYLYPPTSEEEARMIALSIPG